MYFFFVLKWWKTCLVFSSLGINATTFFNHYQQLGWRCIQYTGENAPQKIPPKCIKIIHNNSINLFCTLYNYLSFYTTQILQFIEGVFILFLANIAIQPLQIYIYQILFSPQTPSRRYIIYFGHIVSHTLSDGKI